MQFRIILYVILVGLATVLHAQDEEFISDRNYTSAFLIAPAYSFQFPLGDMQKRFGGNSNLGGTVTYQFLKHWHIGIEGGFLFGNRVKENTMLDSLSTALDGNYGKFINATDNSLVNLSLQERGWNLKFVAGKTVILSKKQHALNHSGLLFLTGIGFLEHKVLIDVREDVLPQLNKTYRKGYDRLSNGFVISQFIGGIFLKHKKWFAIYGGIQADVAFTKNRRPWNFDTYSADTHQRIDAFIGIKLGWIIPVFRKKQQ